MLGCDIRVGNDDTTADRASLCDAGDLLSALIKALGSSLQTVNSAKGSGGQLQIHAASDSTPIVQLSGAAPSIADWEA